MNQNFFRQQQQEIARRQMQQKEEAQKAQKRKAEIKKASYKLGEAGALALFTPVNTAEYMKGARDAQLKKKNKKSWLW
jgi:hypothetical protein